MCHFPLSVIQPPSHITYISSLVLHFRFVSFPLSCLVTTNISLISTVHSHSNPHPMSSTQSQSPPPSTASPPLPTVAQDHLPPNSPLSKVSNPLSRTYQTALPISFPPLIPPPLCPAQSSPFKRSPQSSPSRAVTNDSLDDFQTNAASLPAPTPSAQPDTNDPPPPNVYINGLPPNFPEEQLYNMTKEFGVVLSVRTFTRHVSERPT